MTGVARADPADLVDRLPAHANAVVAVDVAAVLAARGDGADAPRSPLSLPKVAGLQSLLLASHVSTRSMEPAWGVAVMQVGRKPSMAAVAAASGGYADTVAGREAAWCANDVLCVALDDRTLGSVYPADRQFAARWVGLPGAGAAASPTAGTTGRDYLRAAAAEVKAGVPLVIAVDFKDAVSEAGVRRAFEAGRPAWAAGIPGDEASAARLLASLRGVTVRVGNMTPGGGDGALSVDFQNDAAPLAAAAKPLVLGLLAEAGLSVPDLRDWQFTAQGRAVTGQGKLSPAGIQRLVGFLDTPEVSAPDATAQRDGGGAGDGPGRAVAAASAGHANAAASRAYFKSVSSVLDSFRPGASLAESAGWLNRNARRIDQLPADGVDPDLLMFGADASAHLREAAGILSAAQQRVRARALSAQTPAAFAGGVQDSQQAAQARADRANARRQAEQAASEERATAIADASKALQAATEARGKVRAAMAQKYGGGF